MKAGKISTGVYCLHADIYTDDLFEGIWPIPNGVSLNSYIVKGEKTALIDLVSDWTNSVQQFEDCLASIGLTIRCIDYLVLNHLEPDHTGWLWEFMRQNPGVTIIATQKGCNLLKSFYKITCKNNAGNDDVGDAIKCDAIACDDIATCLRPAANGDTLDLGAGRVLTFFETPNLHWPETMVTWDAASGTLFSCDAFGSFGALSAGGAGSDKIFDDEHDEAGHLFFEEECLRYYANIVSSFSGFVEKAIQKLENLQISCIAPGHGLVWRTNPEKIISRYLRYASWARGPAEKRITVVWGSMYGNTKAGVDAVIRGIEKEGIPCTSRRIPNENISWVLADVYRSSGLVLAMPTYEYAMFPPMSYVLDIFRRKHLCGKKVLRIGSWGWVGGAKKDYEAAIESLKWESLESYEWPGFPTEADLQILEERGCELARKIKQ